MDCPVGKSKNSVKTKPGGHPAPAKKRSTILSDKTMKKVFKKFDADHEPDANINDDVNISIDEHVKMNDSYMRTGWYVPKKK